MVNLFLNSNDMFAKLRNDFLDYEANNSSSYKAINFILTAWHLTDWLLKEFEHAHYQGTEDQRLGKFRNELYQKCSSLKTMHDLANGYKHMQVDQDRIKDHSLVGSNSSDISKIHWWNNLSSTNEKLPPLMIEFEDQGLVLLQDVFQNVLEFWEYYFECKLHGTEWR